jgi:hypothetical protein
MVKILSGRDAKSTRGRLPADCINSARWHGIYACIDLNRARLEPDARDARWEGRDDYSDRIAYTTYDSVSFFMGNDQNSTVATYRNISR